MLYLISLLLPLSAEIIFSVCLLFKKEESLKSKEWKEEDCFFKPIRKHVKGNHCIGCSNRDGPLSSRVNIGFSLGAMGLSSILVHPLSPRLSLLWWPFLENEELLRSECFFSSGSPGGHFPLSLLPLRFSYYTGWPDKFWIGCCYWLWWSCTIFRNLREEAFAICLDLSGDVTIDILILLA